MGTIDDFKAEQLAAKILKKYKKHSIEFCKNNIHSLAEILEENGLSPFDCTREMAQKLKDKVSMHKLKRLLGVNDQLIIYTKALNILRKNPSAG